jgi:hypothetical protein
MGRMRSAASPLHSAQVCGSRQSCRGIIRLGSYIEHDVREKRNNKTRATAQGSSYWQLQFFGASPPHTLKIGANIRTATVTTTLIKMNSRRFGTIGRTDLGTGMAARRGSSAVRVLPELAAHRKEKSMPQEYGDALTVCSIMGMLPFFRAARL